jgi:hypothetical protein
MKTDLVETEGLGGFGEGGPAEFGAVEEEGGYIFGGWSWPGWGWGFLFFFCGESCGESLEALVSRRVSLLWVDGCLVAYYCPQALG